MNENRQPMTISKIATKRARLLNRRWSLRKIGVSALASFGCVAICSSAVLAAPAIYVNGAPTTVTAVVTGNQVFVPVHGIFEKLGTSMHVTPAHAVIAHKGSGDIARLAIASRQATVNGASRTLDTPPFMHGSTMFVPLRLISEAAGASVVYSGATHAINITSAPVLATAPVTAAAPAAVSTTTESVAAVAPVAQEHGIPWWVWLLLALVALALLLAFLRRRKPEPIIKTRSGSSDPVIKTRP